VVVCSGFPTDGSLKHDRALPVADVRVETLRRAAQILGGEQQLALQLSVTPSHLGLWLAGVEPTPPKIFLRAVDVVTEDLAREASHPLLD
jgi:DNA-binding transcriptional regulator YdaS (Cro superfamily)